MLSKLGKTPSDRDDVVVVLVGGRGCEWPLASESRVKVVDPLEVDRGMVVMVVGPFCESIPDLGSRAVLLRIECDCVPVEDDRVEVVR